MAVHPGTTVSSGPGPPQVKQATPLLTYKKWPSEQNTAFSPQSTAKMVNVMHDCLVEICLLII